MRQSSSSCFVALVLAALGGTSLGQQSVNSNVWTEPEGKRRDQTFEVLEFDNGRINQEYTGILRYYCTFRGKWSQERHPNDFPRSASFSAPLLVSHSNGYRMWTGSETATLGVEQMAEEGFGTILSNEFGNAGIEIGQIVLGERMFNTTDSQHLKPVNVSQEHPFLSAMVKLTPSPDWFAGFSDLLTISPVTETYYDRLVIRSYVWDAGTDGGQTYTALDQDLDPQVPVTKFTVDNVPERGQFLDPTGTYIPIPCEFECILRVGDGEYVPGVPFNETQIRPPLYVARDDDILPPDDPRSPLYDAGGLSSRMTSIWGYWLVGIGLVIGMTMW